MAQALGGKTALVTGAGKGVGRGIALELARRGCDVAVNDLVAADAESTAAEIAGMGRVSLAVRADVGVAADVDAMFAKVLAGLPRLDILVNNAGIQTWKPLLEVEEEEWDRVIRVNLKGCFLCTQRAARHMKDLGSGRIINIGSGSNKVAFPKLVAYTASKGAIEMFTKVAALELASSGITVNCVAPGAVLVERTKQELPDYAGTFSRLTPLGRVGVPADIGRAVAFLASDEAEFITGQTVWVDGGLFTRPAWSAE
ncbi:MAG: 3-oxoacyl-ACP reductase FabG [Bryobacterales bacterium]|nr:3-oxoacyl-ACP reductase FabG [Bryobacterales bacterium]